MIYILFLLTGLSCGTIDKKSGVDNLSHSFKKYLPIGKQKIIKIELFIADTSLIDPVHRNPPPLIQIAPDAWSFIDSSGHPIFNPTQKISIKDSVKNALIDIFNKYLEIPQDTTIATACSILYRHVFILYDSKGQKDEQIYLCLDCTKLDFRKRHAFIQFLDNDKTQFARLIATLKELGAYVPNYGPAAMINN